MRSEVEPEISACRFCAAAPAVKSAVTAVEKEKFSGSVEEGKLSGNIEEAKLSGSVEMERLSESVESNLVHLWTLQYQKCTWGTEISTTPGSPSEKETGGPSPAIEQRKTVFRNLGV